MNRCILELNECGIHDKSTLSSSSSFSSASVLGQNENISYASSMLIHSLLVLCSAYYHDPRQDGSDAGHGQAIRSADFAKLFSLIFQNADILPVRIMAPSYSIVTDVLNHDSSPPGILQHMLGNSLAYYALVGIQKSVEFSGESILPMSNLISAISITEEGVNLVLANNPFSNMFSIFHEPKCVESDSMMLTPDIPGALGGSIEELLRHHPSLTLICIQAIVSELRHVVATANADLNAEVFDDAATVSFVRHMNYVAIMLTLVAPVLHRKSTTTEFIFAGGLPILFDILNYGLGPSRFLLASLSCTIDPLPNILGYFPVLNGISHCFEHISDNDKEGFLTCLFGEMNKCEGQLMSSLAEYYDSLKGTEFTSKFVADPDNAESTLHFWQFLSTVNKQEVSQSFLERSLLSDHLERFSSVSRGLVKYGYLVHIFSSAVTPISPSQLPFLHKASKDLIDRLKVFDILKNVVQNIYRASQNELCRARCEIVDEQSNKELEHPIYKMMVVARDGAVVRQTSEDSSKKLCKLNYGEIFYSNQRVLNSNEAYRFSMDEGWVGIFRGSNYVEPQLQIIDVVKNDGASLPIVISKQGHEKSSNITIYQGGIGALVFVHNAVR